MHSLYAVSLDVVRPLQPQDIPAMAMALDISSWMMCSVGMNLFCGSALTMGGAPITVVLRKMPVSSAQVLLLMFLYLMCFMGIVA